MMNPAIREYLIASYAKLNTGLEAADIIAMDTYELLKACHGHWWNAAYRRGVAAGAEAERSITPQPVEP